jgi:hypothetical protein
VPGLDLLCSQRGTSNNQDRFVLALLMLASNVHTLCLNIYCFELAGRIHVRISVPGIGMGGQGGARHDMYLPACELWTHLQWVVDV